MCCLCSCVNRTRNSSRSGPQCESQNQFFQLSSNRFLRVDLQGSRVTSDGGLLVVREVDERVGLTRLIQNHLVDSRTERNTQFPLADVFQQSAYSRLVGYEDQNDATWLERDSTFRLMGSDRIWERGVVLTSTVHWFETACWRVRRNLTGLETRSGASGQVGRSRLVAPGRVRCG